MLKHNIFASMPETVEHELFQTLLQKDNVVIERIISKGHVSPATGWFDQTQHEWVIVLQGEGIINFEDGRSVTLTIGDHINIPAHCRHKVSWTTPHIETIWLAVFYDG